MFGADAQTGRALLGKIPGTAVMPLPQTFKEQLQSELAGARKNVERLEKLISLLDANPAIEEFMTLTRSGW